MDDKLFATKVSSWGKDESVWFGKIEFQLASSGASSDAARHGVREAGPERDPAYVKKAIYLSLLESRAIKQN
jgi:hypothetical protein